MGIFFFKILYLCNVTSSAPWWSREALRFFPRLRAKCQLQQSLGQFEVPARFPKFTNFEKARRNPAVSHLTRIVQMSPALSHQLGMAVMLCKKCPLHIFLHSQQVSSVRSPTRPSPSEVPTPHPALYLLDASLP